MYKKLLEFELVPLAYVAYTRATFFLCPWGDSPTRKALFDGIAAGSIPVIFSQASLDAQFPAFMPNPREISIFINTTYDLIGQLERIPKAKVRRMQENILKLKKKIEYRPERTDDAFDVIMNELARYVRNGHRVRLNTPVGDKLLCSHFDGKNHTDFDSANSNCFWQ